MQSCPTRRASVAFDERTAAAVDNSFSSHSCHSWVGSGGGTRRLRTRQAGAVASHGCSRYPDITMEPQA